MIPKMSLFHGAVLFRLLRNEKPTALRLIETHSEERAVYEVNDQRLLVKYSAPIQPSPDPSSPDQSSPDQREFTWTFTFDEDERVFLEGKSGAIALMCGFDSAGDYQGMEICLLEDRKLEEFAELAKATTWEGQVGVGVKRSPKLSLRVYIGSAKQDVTVARKRIDDWSLPD